MCKRIYLTEYKEDDQLYLALNKMRKKLDKMGRNRVTLTRT